MSYSALTSTEVQAGKPVSTTLQSKIKDNFSDHETRIQALEGGSSVTYPPIILRVGGYYSYYGHNSAGTFSGLDAVIVDTINFNLTITGARLLIETAGSTGTTTIDILYKRGAGSWTSIFTTKPSATSGDGSYFLSTNQVLDAGNVALEAGDLIRLDIDAIQTGGKGLLARIDYNKT